MTDSDDGNLPAFKAFRRHPGGTQSPSGNAVPAPAADEGDTDSTMMVGSRNASRAVLDAILKNADQPAADPAPDVLPVAKAAKPAPAAAASPATRKKRPVLIGAAVLTVLLIGGAVLYYPTFHREQIIAGAVADAETAIKAVVLRARDAGPAAPTDPRYRQDVAQLGPVLATLRHTLADHPQESALAAVYARARLLAFEREYAPLFVQGRLDDARARADALLSDLRTLPAAAFAGAAELRAASDIGALASLMVDLRRFARRFPQVSALAPARPGLADLGALDAPRDGFVRLRRLHNMELSVDHPLLTALVQDVENTDLALINRWKEFLISSGG